MKQFALTTVAALAAMILLNGCVVAVGSGPKNATNKPTTGQQLVDLQKARDTGAISEPEFQAQRAKVLEGK